MITVITDSTCDLAPEVVAEYGIVVVPMLIEIDGTTYEDGITITREKFYAGLPTYKDVPKTAACSPGAMAEAYRVARAAGATGIISVHISRHSSGVCAAADIAAADLKAEGLDVRVVDSGVMTIALGMQAVEAVKLARAGKTLDEIVAALEARRHGSRIIVLVDTLKFLRRGGRVSAFSAGIGELLNIKPLLEMREGVISGIDKIRTRKRGIDRVVEEIQAWVGGKKIVQLSIVYTGGEQSEDLAALKARIEALGPVEPAAPILATPIIAAHVGPLGLAVIAVTG